MYEYGGSTGSYAYDMSGILQNGTDTYLKDGHGSVIGKYSSACVSLGAASYDAFGNSIISLNDPFGYCGEYLDSESGLIYLRNRYYDPSTGRFITEDPAKDGMNWYSYCAGNPVNLWDPWGLSVQISGTEREVSIFAEYIKILTDDKVIIDEDGNITMTEDYQSSRFGVGTSLIQQLVDDEDITVIISVNKGKGEVDTSKHKNVINIKMDINAEYKKLAWDYKTESIQNMTTPSFIVLAHELIHAQRYFNGSHKSVGAFGIHEYYDEAGNL